MTTQEHIDGLIASIWHAQNSSSVTNIMVARVLDWLNSRANELQALIEAGETEWRKELEIVNFRIQQLSETLKGVNSVANAAHGRADTNARNITILSARLNVIIDELIRTGYLPSGFGSGAVQEPTASAEHVDRGTRKEGETYYSGELNEATGMIETSHVWYMGCKYRCLTTGTGEPPKYNSPDWEFEEGDPEPRLEFRGAEDALIAAGETKNIDCRVFIYNQDATEDVAEWEITRDTGSETEDTAWELKDKVRDFDGNIDISYAAADDDLGYGGKASFLVTAKMKTGTELYGMLEF